MVAEHLVKYIETPLFIAESLYDVWQLANIIELPCIDHNGWPPNINNCTNYPDQMYELDKHTNYTRDLLQ